MVRKAQSIAKLNFGVGAAEGGEFKGIGNFDSPKIREDAF